MANDLKVVFRSDVRGIAKAGDVKQVSAGYARNFLFPRKLAFTATPTALKQWETERQGALAHAERLRTDAQSLAERVNGVTLTVKAKASPEGRLFGSVSRQELADLLAKEGVTIDKKLIVMAEPLKQIGAAAIPVHLASGIDAQLKVMVVSEG